MKERIIMLEQLAEKYYNQGYNCAESIVHAGNEAYQLGLSEHDMRMAAAFGAGLQVGDVCGVLAGAGCVLSCLYVETRAHESAVIRPAVTKMVRELQKEYGGRTCAQIKPKYFNKEIRCKNTVLAGAKVIERVIGELDQEFGARSKSEK